MNNDIDMTKVATFQFLVGPIPKSGKPRYFEITLFMEGHIYMDFIRYIEANPNHFLETINDIDIPDDQWSPINVELEYWMDEGDPSVGLPESWWWSTKRAWFAAQEDIDDQMR